MKPILLNYNIFSCSFIMHYIYKCPPNICKGHLLQRCERYKCDSGSTMNGKGVYYDKRNNWWCLWEIFLKVPHGKYSL